MVEEIDRNVSINLLSFRSRKVISDLLNSDKIIPTDDSSKLQRDWRGLADLCCISGTYAPTLQKEGDPTTKILNLWQENNPEKSTVAVLFSFLEKLDRFDVIADVETLVDNDIKNYHSNPFELNAPLAPNLECDKYILTRDDLNRISEGKPLENYDAFVLFADDDIGFATELIETMEKEYHMKFCVKDRDLVVGGLEYDRMIQAITLRCYRLIVILSDAFYTSPANKFYLSFGQALGIEKERRLIPLTYKKCSLPEDIRCFFLLDYNRSSRLWNFWDKLRDTIRVPLVSVSSVNYLLTRTASDCNNFLHQEEVRRPLSHVKFSSMVNIPSYENDSIRTVLGSSASVNSIGMSKNNDEEECDTGKDKSGKKRGKIKWKKISKIFSRTVSKKSQDKNVVEDGKEKRKIVQNHFKRNAATALAS